MFQRYGVLIALLAATSVAGISGAHSAKMLEGAERSAFIAETTKACVGTKGEGQVGVLSKPMTERYCACVAKGAADRLSKDDLTKEAESAELSEKAKTILDEEVAHCVAKEGGKDLFVGSAMKACMESYDQDNKSATIGKPAFEQHCACVVKGVADRIPTADLLKQDDSTELSKEHDALVDEVTTQCLSRQGGREFFVANAIAGCVRTYSEGKKSSLMSKPAFTQYCTCVVKDMADRMPMGDLIKIDRPNQSEQNQAIADEAVERCLKAAKGSAQ